MIEIKCQQKNSKSDLLVVHGGPMVQWAYLVQFD